MSCNRCSCDLPDDASFCLKCGADQHVQAEQGQQTGRVLRRSMTNRKIAGVCGGLAEYVNTDATIVRIAWAALAFVPGVVLYAAVAYPLVWLLVPGEKRHDPAKANRQLHRSTNNLKIAGICGGFGEYFDVDPTAVRLLWAVLSVWPGFVVGGMAVYAVAWLVMPTPPERVTDASTLEIGV